MKCKICGNDMILGDLGWYCDKDEEHYENVMPLTEEQKDKLIEHRFKQVSDMRRQITDLQSQFAQKDKQLEKLKSDNHTLISDNAYQEADIFELNSRIEQLQKQLEESETKQKSLEEKVKFITEEKEENFVDGQKYNELKEQLIESEKSKESYRLQNEQHHLQLLQFYSRLGVEAFGADIHEKALETLMIMKEQLAEKDKQIAELKKQLEEEDKTIQGLIEEQKCLERSCSYQMFLGIQKQLAENEKEISEYVKIVDDLHKQLSDKCDFCDKTKDQDKISFAVEQLEKVDAFIKSDDCFDLGDVRIKIDDQIKQLKEMK